MNVDRWFELGVIGILALLLAGQIIDQPLLLGFVRTGSMQPALAPGDGFIAIPPSVAGQPNVGDVVVYRAQQVNGGGLTTHRIVDETARGYITQGDANPFTDQSGGEPPVKSPQIVAVVLQLGGTVVMLPELGTGVILIRDAIQQLLRIVPRRFVIGGAVTLVIILALTDENAGQRGRTSVTDRDAGHNSDTPLLTPKRIVLLTGGIVILAATASMLFPLGPTEYRVVSAQSNLPGPGVIPAGESESTTYQVPGGSFVPIKYYVEPASDGVAVKNGSGVVTPGNVTNATVRLSVPPDTGSYRRYVSEKRFPLVLPVTVIESMYAIHPLAPVVLIDTLLAIPTLAAAQLFTGRRRLRDRAGAQNGIFEQLGGRR